MAQGRRRAERAGRLLALRSAGSAEDAGSSEGLAGVRTVDQAATIKGRVINEVPFVVVGLLVKLVQTLLLAEACHPDDDAAADGESARA